jgi:4-hydroxy-4-methyl-2-oxoglutarate aldolase
MPCRINIVGLRNSKSATENGKSMSHDLAQLRTIFTSALASDCLDAMGYGKQVLGEDIHMLSGEGVMLGYAFPVQIEVVDSFPEVPYVGLLKALDAIQKDQVYVTPTARAGKASLWGELLSTACNFKGVAGSLGDGPSRDLARTRAMGFKIFGTGSLPVDINGRYEVVAHNVPGVIDGVSINPGDLVVGDVDGVTIVPVAAIDEVVNRVIEKNSGETNFRKAVKEGMAPSAAFAKFGVL